MSCPVRALSDCPSNLKAAAASHCARIGTRRRPMRLIGGARHLRHCEMPPHIDTDQCHVVMQPALLLSGFSFTKCTASVNTTSGGGSVQKADHAVQPVAARANTAFAPAGPLRSCNWSNCRQAAVLHQPLTAQSWQATMYERPSTARTRPPIVSAGRACPEASCHVGCVRHGCGNRSPSNNLWASQHLCRYHSSRVKAARLGGLGQAPETSPHKVAKTTTPGVGTSASQLHSCGLGESDFFG